MHSVLTPRIFLLILTIMAGADWIVEGGYAQVTEFKDGKKLELQSESEFLRIQALIRDNNWQAAATQIATLIDRSDNELIRLPVETSHSSSRFVSLSQFASFMISSWHASAPEALELYRDLVEAESEAFLKKAIYESSLSDLQKVATDYFLSRVGDEATDRLAQICFEKGEFTLAARHWDSLIADPDFPATPLIRYPDSDLMPADLMCRSLAASLLNQQNSLVERKIAYIEQRYPADKFPQQQFTFLNQTDLDLAGLKALVATEQRSLAEAISQVSKTPDQSQPIDIKGSAAWKTSLEPQSKSNAPYFQLAPAVAEGMQYSLSIFPTIENGVIYWRDTHKIYRKILNDDPAQNAPSSPEVIWSTPFLKETVESRRKVIGRPVMDVEIRGQKLFARMGDPRTSYRNDTVTRNRSYLIGLDLEKGGKVLPGFPLKNDDPRIEFDATPLYDEGYLYVVRRKTFRSNSVGRISIQCLELSPSNRVADPKLVWSHDSISAESNNKGLWDEISQTRLIAVESKIAFVGQGFVALFDKKSGSVEWISDYERDRFVFPGGAGARQPKFAAAIRALDDGIFHAGKLFVAPADSNFLFSFDAATGKCLWRARTPNTSHLLGVTDQHVILSGHVLQWIDRRTGRLAARFPAGVSESSVGFGLDSQRGFGKGAIFNGHLYWPTLDKVFVFDTNLDRGQNPLLKKVIDLRMRRATGGHLHVGKAIMLIAAERTLWTFAE